jgi:hypothetical protein
VEREERRGVTKLDLTIEDSDDGRASRIRLTARGRTFARHARTFAREFESHLAEKYRGTENKRTTQHSGTRNRVVAKLTLRTGAGYAAVLGWYFL